jgi:hypothetical protein
MHDAEEMCIASWGDLIVGRQDHKPNQEGF